MYHDTIHIIFESLPMNNIEFKYNFLISKNSWLPNHKAIEYQELLNKLHNYGFNSDYINFPDVKDKTQNIFCEYNGTPNFLIFFKAFEKVLKPQGFNITFEYGSMIGGKFYPNNMNFYSSISFMESHYGDYDVIYGVSYCKYAEHYQIVDSEGNIVDSIGSTSLGGYSISICNNKENPKLKDEFFKRQRVSVYLRKYKLEQLRDLNLTE